MRHRFVSAPRRAMLLAALPALAALGGCSSGGGDSTGGTGPQGAIAIALSPASGSVPQGGSSTIGVTVSRSGGFTGTVSITATGAPSGTTAQVSASSTVGTVTAAVITVNVSGSATPGTSTITVHATGSGVSEVTKTFTLTVTAVASGSFGLSLSPAQLSVAQGANGSTQVSVVRSNFPGAVALTATGAPGGVTATFSPQSVTGATSTLTIAVGVSVVAQQYTITVHGAATGAADPTATLTLTVTSTGSSGGFSLSATGSPIAISQGGNGQATVNITRTGGFSGAVALAVEGAPAGLTASVNPASTTGGSSTLSVVASASLAASSYTLTVRGTATGLADQTTTVQVTVSASGGSGNVTLDFTSCSTDTRARWVAYQDGAGTWTQVAGASDMYHFTITAATGGFAYVTQPQLSSSTTLAVQFMSRAEMSAAPILFCQPGPIKLVNGTLANVGAAQLVNISMGGAFALAVGAIPNFALPGVADGAHDLVAYLYGGAPSATDKMIIRRDQNVATNGSLAPLDFGGAEAFTPASASISVSGLVAGDGMVSTTSYLTGASCDAGTLYQQFPFASPFTVYGVPAGQQRGSDFHSVLVTAAGANSNHSAQLSFHTLGSKAVVLPAPLASVNVQVVNAGYKRLIATFGLAADYNSGASLYYIPKTGVPHPVTISATAAYIGSSNATLAMPDFTGVAGWSDVWAAGVGIGTNYTISAVGSNASTMCQEGARRVTATVTGSN